MSETSKTEQNEVKKDQMLWREYQILEEATARANTSAYAVLGIFLGGLLTASAILIPEVVRSDCGLQLIGYVVASAAILVCAWFWFRGIHLRWRVINVIMYHRLMELEQSLPFKAHTRIDDFYTSQTREWKRQEPLWPKNGEPPWYKKVMETLHSLIPWPPTLHYWWHRILLVITVAYIVAFAFPILRCVVTYTCDRSFLR